MVHPMSEEKSLKLKVTESNKSCENNKDEESFQSDEDTEGMMTFINESDSSAGKIREFNTNTKKARDIIQSSSARYTLQTQQTQEALSPSYGTPQMQKRSRQNLLNYTNHRGYETNKSNFESMDSICLEGQPTKVK